ncbi:hypothetical protein E3Q22_04112 [Wallemia mellicola]|uniref:HAD-like protein n=1 Tax=Wallemia mellicola TaxID=1708541 RepID=A0A4T0QQB8_9BASI|nr:hypothetical protein E3Q23_04107 [Wallemia mellicola]TIB74565.1 hypothetical protein E3Q24_00500 [Wallemia mellicola]TIB74909.1 hypothetical protein E3Q22_04112 [Wallemia mellicola]TIB85179.1 hypothetical protein E3Q19_04264 [Wallemia mellicola]TIB89918.1 hypothetical protein E3Q21_00367 [Wallemia mellicola]
MKIAIDFDDVISSTNRAVCQWHNRVYDTEWTIDDFHCEKNPGWGNAQETFKKVTAFYNDNNGLNATQLVTGAKEALLKLKSAGHDLIIVTARNDNQREMTRNWLDHHLEGLFDKLYFTGQFTRDGDLEAENEDNEGIPTKNDQTHLSKADIIDRIGAHLLVDDSIENAFGCANHVRKNGVLAGKPIRTLLLSPIPPSDGIPIWHYPWNVELSKQDTEEDALSYDERKKRGLPTGESRQPTNLPSTIKRVTSWEDIIRKIDEYDTHLHSNAATIEASERAHPHSIQVQA